MEVDERNRLVESVVPWCASLVNRYTVAHQDREDVLQTVLLRLLANAHGYRREKGAPSTWAAAVAFSVLRRPTRKKELRTVPLPFKIRDPRQQLAEDFHDNAEQCDRVRAAMERLDDDDRAALERVVLDGQPVAGINRDLSRERCRQVFRRALARARQLMETRP